MTSTPPQGAPLRRGRRAAGPARVRLGLPEKPAIVLVSVALAVVVLDQATKAWASSVLSEGQRIDLIGSWLGLVLVHNPGAAFSFATGQTWVFTLVAVVVSVIVIRTLGRMRSYRWAVTLGLVLGGAVGNLIDRLVRAPGVFRGHVVDFIDYGGLFVGNVADIAIVGAAGAIIVLTFMGLEIDGTRAGEDAAAGEEAARRALGEADPRGGARPQDGAALGESA
ncbi:signal peptidase II [Actinomyces oricola]